jgi:hypothetical protein
VTDKEINLFQTADRNERRLLWSIVALAALLRVAFLGAHPLLFDEAFVAVGARDIARNHTPMWDAISNAPFVALLALVVRVVGDGAFILRVLPALAGTASVYVIYVLQRRFFSRNTALLGTLLFAVHPFAVAFSRILFADPVQVWCVLAGWLTIDRYALETHPRHRRLLLAEVAIVWALAFLAKYNAIVPGGLWVLAGVAGGRYTIRRAIPAAFAVLAGPALTLLLWPYDAPIWFAAYLRQGGRYDIGAAASYFTTKLRLIFFGLTPLVTTLAIVLRIRRPSAHTRATALFAIYAIAYLITVIALGRTFERYLLVVVPALSMTVAGLTNWLWQAYRDSTSRFWRGMTAATLLVIAGTIAIGMTIEYIRYGAYLDNSVDIPAVVRRTAELRAAPDTRVFWIAPEPVIGYYLGFTRDYSRPLAIDTAAAGSYNYFEGRPMPHSLDRAPYHVLESRRFARSYGFGRMLTEPGRVIDAMREIASKPVVDSPNVDYLNDPICRTGDLLVLQSGATDIQGEPLLERIDTNSLPPTIDRLPLDRFDVVAAFRPEGPAPITDTILTKYRAGMWILRKR